jgi:putative transposase
LTGLDESRRAEAMTRFEVIRPAIEDGVPLAACAAEAEVPLRTAQRWLARYRQDGLAGLARRGRGDAGRRRLRPEIVDLVEGLALRRPRLSAAAIHRRVSALVAERGWAVPSYATVHGIARALDPAMVTLAHEGLAAWRDRYELIHRHRAARPNALWQADHTMIDLLVLGTDGAPVRPWLTVVMDDHSRAVAGYTVFAGAPSALNLSLALRQAIWRKADPAWPVCGVPDVLHVDHGTDFTSIHLRQAAADLRMRIVHSAIGRPQGRGKVERFFGTLNTELLSSMPGWIAEGRMAGKPALDLPALDAAIGAWITRTYHARTHSQTGTPPVAAWLGHGWLPRMPNSLEELDLLLILVAKPRVVRRDGIRFQGLRYVDTTLAAFVGEWVTIRYDPRDLVELRVFHKNRFLCRAVCPDLDTEAVTLADIQTARTARRRALRRGIDLRAKRLADLLHEERGERAVLPAPAPPLRSKHRLRLYEEDD